MLSIRFERCEIQAGGGEREVSPEIDILMILRYDFTHENDDSTRR